MSDPAKYLTARSASFRLPAVSGQSDNVSSGEVATSPENMIPLDSMVCGVLLSLLTLFMLAVNGRVILAFILDKKLRYPSNLLVLNLSVSDFLFGLLSLPFLTVNQVTGRWVFGQTACSLWQFVTLWMRCESAFTLALVSFDRYLMVKRAAQYRRKTRRTSTFVLLASSWVLSLVLTGPAVLVWDVLLVKGVVWEERCLTDFVLEAPAYNMFLHILMLLGPSAIMTFCYVQVVRDLKKRAKRRALNKSPLPVRVGRFEDKHATNETPEDKEDNTTEKSKTPPPAVRPCRLEKVDVLVTIAETRDKRPGAYPSFAVAKTVDCQRDVPKLQEQHKTTVNMEKIFAAFLFRKRTITNEDKVSRTVGLLIFVYIITCAPLSIVTVVMGIFKNVVTSSLYKILFVVMATSGAANPVIYAYRSPPIREHLLSVPCRRSRAKGNHYYGKNFV
ncbi:hypothetical protein Bbelb_137080 [Branchiostoma belcheri]|nr:hypothetical protein Bbelb_137080 [Branchiostoma belcheri]